MLFEHRLTAHLIKQVEGGTRGDSWWVSFVADDENISSGQVLHIHAETPEAWRDVVQDYLAWLTVAGGAVGALGLALGPAAAVPAVAGAAWKIASNRDNSYDFYVIVESSEEKSWKLELASALGYKPRLNFKGFVSDQAHKPPIGAGLSAIPLIPTHIPRIKAIANKFRYQPKP